MLLSLLLGLSHEPLDHYNTVSLCRMASVYPDLRLLFQPRIVTLLTHEIVQRAPRAKKNLGYKSGDQRRRFPNEQSYIYTELLKAI